MNETIKLYNDRISERITDDGTADLRERLVRFYKPELVRTVTQNLIKNEEEQRTQTNRVRQAIVKKLGDDPDFSVFNERFSVTELLDMLDKECANSARIAHNNLVQNRKEKLLGVSIIERMKERYGGDSQELRSFVTELVSRAGNYLAFDQSERFKSGPGIPSGAQTAVSKMSVIMPKAPEEAEFVAKLKGVFQGARTTEVEIVDGDTKPNEIVIVSLTNLFPLRYVSQVGFLKQRFNQRVDGTDGQRARLELLCEGDGRQFPSLFVPSQEEAIRYAIPYLLLAKSLNLIQDTRNPQTGATELALMAKDENGFDTDPIYLGKTFKDSIKDLDVPGSERIRSYVHSVLSGGENALANRRIELQKSILASVELIRAECDNNIQDEVYKRFLEAGKQAVILLKLES